MIKTTKMRIKITITKQRINKKPTKIAVIYGNFCALFQQNGYRGIIGRKGNFIMRRFIGCI